MQSKFYFLKFLKNLSCLFLYILFNFIMNLSTIAYFDLNLLFLDLSP